MHLVTHTERDSDGRTFYTVGPIPHFAAEPFIRVLASKEYASMLQGRRHMTKTKQFTRLTVPFFRAR